VPALPRAVAHRAHAQDTTRAKIDGVISTSFSSGVPVSRLVVDGNVALAQRLPLPRPAGGVYAPYLLSPLASLDAARSAADASPEGILAAAAARNFTLSFAPAVAPVWAVDAFVPGSPDAAATLGTAPRAFALELTVRVPIAPLLVRPSVASELKFGWIQYAALLAVTAPLAWLVRRALFGLLILETTVLADATRSVVKHHLS